MVDFKIVLMAPAIMAVLIGVFVVINQLNEVAFGILDSSTSIYYVNIIKVMLGIIGLVLVLGVIYYAWHGTQQPMSPPPNDFY